MPDCAELSQVVFDIAMIHASEPGISTVDKVVESMQRDIPDIDRKRVVDSILEVQAYQRAVRQELENALSEAQVMLKEASKQRSKVKREATNEDQIRKMIATLRKALANNTLTPSPEPTPQPTEAIAELRRTRDSLYKDYLASEPSKNQRRKRMEPVVEARLRNQIRAIDEAIEQGTEVEGRKSSPINNPVINMLRSVRNDMQQRLKRATPSRIRELQKQIKDLEEKTKQPVDTSPPSRHHGPEVEPVQNLIDRKRALQAELAQARKDQRDKKKLTDETNRLSGFLSRGELPPRKIPSKPKTTSDAVAMLRSITNHLKTDIKNSEPAQAKKLSEQLAKLTERLVTASYSPPVSEKDLATSEAAIDSLFQRNQLRKKIRRKIESLKPITDTSRVLSIANIPRAIMSSGDLSASGRQAGFVTFSNPEIAVNALGPALKSYASEKNQLKAQMEIDSHPLRAIADLAGLQMTELDGALDSKEEAYQSNMADKIPLIGKWVVRPSERAYITTLNKMRMDYFAKLYNTLGVRAGEVTKEQAEALAHLVNIGTGRGYLPQSWEGSAQILNALFFAPKFAISRFQLALGYPLLKAAVYHRDAQLTRLVAEQYGRYLIGIGTVYSLAMLASQFDDEDEWEISTDILSSDWGKIRVGNIRIDPLSGLSQAQVFTARMIMGERHRTGKYADYTGTVHLRGPEKGYKEGVRNEIHKFAEYKFSPIAALTEDIISGEHRDHTPVTPESIAKNYIPPLSTRDIYDVLIDRGLDHKSAIGLLTLLGIGVQVYD